MAILGELHLACAHPNPEKCGATTRRKKQVSSNSQDCRQLCRGSRRQCDRDAAHSKREVTNAYLDPRICKQQQPTDLLFRLTGS